MNDLARLRAQLGELERAGGCAHPVRVAGEALDPGTGEYWATTVGVACKDRRVAVCPACAARYRDDAWHLIAAGLRGGKGVPEDVATHPVVFATLTAPSFGAVHAYRDGSPCRPRRAAPVCFHGVALGCTARHEAHDAAVGAPLCPACFDYEGAVLWNAHAGRLWARTATLIRQRIARGAGLSIREGMRLVRCSYVKVAEFQRRGLVHLHVVVRADGPEGPGSPPPAWLDAELAVHAVREAAADASVHRLGDGASVVWGKELDVTEVGAGSEDKQGAPDPAAVARYLAKYAVKASEETGALARRVRSLAVLWTLGLDPHPERLVETAWHLGARRELRPLRLRAHAHTFGFGGHFATKSRRYSTTFEALRAARAAFYEPDDDVEREWHYAGHGYSTASTSALALAVAEARRSLPHRAPTVPRDVPGDIPAPSDQGKRR